MKDKKLIIGLLGESPNDTHAIKNLLENHFNPFMDGKRVERIECCVLVERVFTGSQIDSKLFHNIAKSAYHENQPDLVILIRDLDQLQKFEERHKKFGLLKKALHAQAGHTDLPVIFLLIQYSIENLILADVERANRYWNAEIDLGGINARDISDPIGHIKNSKGGYPHYSEYDCRELFQFLRYEVIATHHTDFQDFDGELRPHYLR